MISIRLKNYNRSPKRLICLGARRQIRRAATSMSGAICTGNYYRDNTVRNLLKAYSLGKRTLTKKDKPKCYYCESQGEAMLPLEVEHYRPKDGVNTKDLVAGQVHNGYYWLANEWSNLLLSCRACNGADAKGMYFPIVNNHNRVFHLQPVNARNILNRRSCKLSSVDLVAEDPILLNPEFDIPEAHLTFDRTGQIQPLAGSNRGNLTITTLNLRRGALLSARIDVLNDFIKDLNVFCEARNINRLDSDANLQAAFEMVCYKIIERRKTSSAFSLWGNYINNNLEQLITLKLPMAFRQVFRDAYTYALANPI